MMHHDALAAAAVLEFLGTPPAQIRATVEAMPAADVMRLSDNLDTVAHAIAWRLGYLRGRRNWGLDATDAGHAAAVKAANGLLTKLRKLLGYAYPASGAIHV